jgi:hypothetical protein
VRVAAAAEAVRCRADRPAIGLLAAAAVEKPSNLNCTVGFRSRAPASSTEDAVTALSFAGADRRRFAAELAMPLPVSAALAGCFVCSGGSLRRRHARTPAALLIFVQFDSKTSTVHCCCVTRAFAAN